MPYNTASLVKYILAYEFFFFNLEAWSLLFCRYVFLC